MPASNLLLLLGGNTIQIWVPFIANESGTRGLGATRPDRVAYGDGKVL